MECDDCACNFYSCIVQIDDKYQAAIGTDFDEADRLARVRNDIDFYWGLYMMAKRCGNDTAVICAKILSLSNSENCTCGGTTPVASQEVIPWASIAGGGGTGSVWFSGATVPSAGLGSDDDFYLRTTNGDVYKKASGAWGVIMNIQGDDGADGTPGSEMLRNWVGSIASSGTSEMTLVSHNLDNTPDLVMATNGDMLHIRAVCKLAQNENGKTMKLYFGNTIIAEHFTDTDIIDINQYVILEGYVTRRTAIVQAVKGWALMGGLPGTLNNIMLNTGATEDMNSDVLIKLTGQNEVAQPDIEGIELTVMLFKIPDTTDVDPDGDIVGVWSQEFTAGGAQTDFVVTDFTMNDNFVVFVDGLAAPITDYSRSGNTVIFGSGMSGGEIVKIIN